MRVKSCSISYLANKNQLLQHQGPDIGLINVEIQAHVGCDLQRFSVLALLRDESSDDRRPVRLPQFLRANIEVDVAKLSQVVQDLNIVPMEIKQSIGFSRYLFESKRLGLYLFRNRKYGVA